MAAPDKELWDHGHMSPSGTLRTALDVALGTLLSTEVDKAAVELAKHYADGLDNGADSTRLGPAYLAVLESLGMTPRARAAQSGGKVTTDAGPKPLDQLRARRASRINGAATVDATAP